MKTILSCLTLSCVLLSSQTQFYPPNNGFYPQPADPNNIYFPERPDVLPLSTTSRLPEYQADAVKKIFGNAPAKNDGVEIEKSNEISATTIQQSVPRGPGIEYNPAPQILPPRHGVPLVDSYGHPISQTVPNTSRYNRLLFSVTKFGINLLKNLDTSVTGNVIVSPYSITSLLSLLQQGSTGDTQEQLTTALNMNPAASAAEYSAISNDFKARFSGNILKTANSVFVGPNFYLNPKFKKVAQETFASDVIPASFGSPALAAEEINDWVSSKTNKKITKLFSPDSLDPTTQMVLVNAIYFKGIWEVPFRVESTVSKDFHLRNGHVKPAQFMRMRRGLKAGVDPATNAKVVILPFEHNQYSMMVILPPQGVTNLLNTLTDDRLVSYLTFPVVETELELPKFTIRGEMDLQIALRNLGITKIFGPYAGLGGLGTYQSNPPQISSAVHSAVLSIDEQGASAAAATAFGAVALSYDEPAMFFRADRPFVVVLLDTASSVPLFMAKIENPSP